MSEVKPRFSCYSNMLVVAITNMPRMHNLTGEAEPHRRLDVCLNVHLDACLDTCLDT